MNDAKRNSKTEKKLDCCRAAQPHLNSCNDVDLKHTLMPIFMSRCACVFFLRAESERDNFCCFW